MKKFLAKAKEKVASSARFQLSMFTLGFALGLSSPAAQAGGVNFGTMGNNISQNANGIASGAHAVMMVAGLIMAAVGIVMIASAHKKHESHMGGIAMLIAGAALASITAIVSSGSMTLFGGDSSNLQSIGVTQ